MSITYQSNMAQTEIKEGWWAVKWPGQDEYDLVEFVRIAQVVGLGAWGYRHTENENPMPLSSMVTPDVRLNLSPAHILRNTEQLIQETRDFGTIPFYRGHSRFEWELAPAVFREPCKGDERSMLNDFRNRAPVRYADSPAAHDLCSWLSLAQHYGLPTRVLDWTLSPLVAAYFATVPDATNDERPGAIWVLNAKKLNEMTADGGGILCFSMDNKEVEELVKPAFDDKFTGPGNVIAVLPSERDLRLFAQQSVFTLHGDRKSLQEWREVLIPDEAEHGQLLMCAVLSPEAKVQIRSDLERLGIHEASLFPDLANLARYIAHDKRNWKR